MGLMGLGLIENVCGLVLFLGAAGLILEVGVENRHVGLSSPSALDDSPKVFFDCPFCTPNP
ncbi:hypothetical protein H5410_003598 [Solanum commersonii]|uniref:Uncharacterized protein n=1 Tax=Solanum commersonii TaxID=4109 RepID=A0A9J6B5C2_SOLCO|nr:hypothetical protein H5410_003598 [Solanum commersonii]